MVISMLITRMNITGLMNPETEAGACAFLNEERKAHALSFHKEKNRAQSVGAWLLFTYTLHRWLQVSEQKLKIVTEMRNEGTALTVTEFSVEKVLEELRTLPLTEREKLLWASQVCIGEHGKPYLQNRSDIFFNLSHSGKYVLCGIADRQIGVDIQKRHDKDVSGVKEKIHNAQDKEEDFFLLFSAKEAFCKCTGEGLQRDLSHIAVDCEKGTVKDTVTGDAGRLFTGTHEGYAETAVII